MYVLLTIGRTVFILPNVDRELKKKKEKSQFYHHPSSPALQLYALKIYLLLIFKSHHSVGIIAYKKTYILLYFCFIHLSLQLATI